MVMTVRLPLRISTTCDALLVSFALLPATKKPQNACARPAGAAAMITAVIAPNPRLRIADMPSPCLIVTVCWSLGFLPPLRRLARDAEQRHRRAHLRFERDLSARRRRQPFGGGGRRRSERISGRAAPVVPARLLAGDRPGPVVADDVAPLEVVHAAGLDPRPLVAVGAVPVGAAAERRLRLAKDQILGQRLLA